MDQATLFRMMSAAAARPIEFVASAQNSGTGSTLSFAKPTGTQENDLMVAFAIAVGDATWTPPTGWTEVVDQGARPNLMIAYKVAGASEGSSYTFTKTGTNRGNWVIVTYRNAAYDVVGSIVTTQSSGVQTASAITLSQSKSTLLAFFCSSDDTGTWSSPSAGLAALANDASDTAGVWALYSDDDVTSGSTGSKSATNSNLGDTLNPACVLVGIKPA